MNFQPALPALRGLHWLALGARRGHLPPGTLDREDLSPPSPLGGQVVTGLCELGTVEVVGGTVKAQS